MKRKIPIIPVSRFLLSALRRLGTDRKEPLTLEEMHRP